MDTPRARPFAVRGRLAIGGELVTGAVIVDGERIVAIVRDPRDGDLPDDVRDAPIVAPGFIDLQMNGGFGVDFAMEPTRVGEVAARLPEVGVTSFVPTLVTSDAATYARALDALGRAPVTALGAEPLGVHLEGPLLSPARAGAHVRALVEQANDALVATPFRHEAVRIVTLAPERDGALAWIRELVGRGVVVAVGHSDATYEQAALGFDAGATLATHLFSAMAPFHHRAPGIVGAALTDDRVTTSIIADGVHLHPAAIRLALRAKGTGNVAVISDAIAAMGMPAGRHALAGREVVVGTDDARLADGTLAGSIVALDGAVRRLTQRCGVSAPQAIALATETPARVLGLADRGRLAPGLRADLVLLSDALEPVATLVRGRVAVQPSAGSGQQSPSTDDQR